MASLDARHRRRLCTPASVLIIACLVSLLAGLLFGKRLGERSVASLGSNVLLQSVPPASVGNAPEEAHLPLKPICLNTCAKARNGWCEDGRVNNTEEAHTPRTVWCDLGTDCDDCGPWMPSGTVKWTSPDTPGPIGLLVSKGVPVRVKNSSTTPSFQFAYTDPRQDYDVSSFFEAAGLIERSITKIFYHIFRARCMAGAKAAGAENSDVRALFVDVGANFGWFSLLGAAMGCRVVAFEPVPHFHAFFEYSAHLNGFMPLIDMRSSVVANASGSDLELVVPSKGIWGTAGIGGLNIDPAIRGNTNERLLVRSVALDDVIKEDVLLLKVDVEGWEWSVMAGAKRLLERSVENVIMEYSPGVPERHFRFDDIKATVQMLLNLIKAGYRIGHIGEMGKHGGDALESDLEVFEEVTAANLAYDMRDAEIYSRHKLGCPIPIELRKFKAWVPQCGLSLPEDVSPHSLRSMIGHNTNVWASKDTSLLKLEGTVGIIKLDADPKEYFTPKGSTFGMGSRFCAHMEPAVQVRHRCHCTVKEVCGAEEQLVQRLAGEGKIATSYRLPTGTAAQATQ